MSKQIHVWTKEEDLYLQENYTNSDINIMCTFLQRNKKAIYNRGNFLGLNRIKPKTTWTTALFKNYVIEISNGEYRCLSEYVKTSIKVQMKHTVCGFEYWVTPNKFISGRRCPRCATIKVHIRQRKPKSQLELEISQISNRTFKLVGEYVNNSTPIKIYHTKCQNTFEVIPYNFLTRKRCPICDKRKSIAKSHDTFVKEVREKYGDEYEILGTYTNAQTHLLVKHNCGHEWLITPSNLLRGYGCPICGLKKCSESNTKLHNTFIKEVEVYGNDEYVVLGQYVNNRTRIKLQHVVCGHEWDVLPGNFLKGRRCPRCTPSSKGETVIEEFLVKHNIAYECQYVFDECINPETNYKLKFDFAIFDDIDKKHLRCLIEYQGEGHYLPIDWAGKGAKYAQENLIKYQYRDTVKMNFCQSNNIQLILIPYWEFYNIEQTLINFFNIK